MRIEEMLSGIPIIITNEEAVFVDKFNDKIYINSLDEHQLWLARNLVRKGIYEISKDNLYLVRS